MFAVIKTGGRQYRVVPNDVLEIGKIEGQVGTIVQLGEVLVVGADTPVLGTPTVAGASVAAEVLDHKRGPKVIAFKKRRRKNSRRKRGYRDEITVLRITEILTDNAKPTVGPVPSNWRPYLDKLPSDPWKNPYQYANPGLKGEIDVYSFGADGVAGGEGKNADIGSWQ